MPRTDNDSWAITESVGATALGVAAARAAETESDNPLINDPFARIFVDAAGDGIWSMYTNRTLLAGATDLDPDLRAPIQQMIDFMAARTAFFDEYFLATADAGVSGRAGWRQMASSEHLSRPRFSRPRSGAVAGSPKAVGRV